MVMTAIYVLLIAIVIIVAVVLISLWRIRHSGYTPMNTSSIVLTDEQRANIVNPPREEVFDDVRLVHDFLHLLWDMSVRTRTWNWETALVSFSFYREAAAYKFRWLFPHDGDFRSN